MRPSLRALFLASLAGLLLPLAALAQEGGGPAPWTPDTGDAVVDGRLADINRYAGRYPDAFIDELVRYFDAPRALLEDLLVRQERAAGDLYYACALAHVSGRPCRGVIEAWSAGHPDGWQGIARELGVAPDDARARRLRDGIGESYRRWGRPLPDAG